MLFSVVFLVFIPLIATQTLPVSSLLCYTYRIETIFLFSWRCSKFSAVNFPLRCFRWISIIDMCSFLFISKHFLISIVNYSLTYGSFINVLFQFPYFFLEVIYNLIPTYSENKPKLFHPFKIYWDLFDSLEYALSWSLSLKKTKTKSPQCTSVVMVLLKLSIFTNFSI